MSQNFPTALNTGSSLQNGRVTSDVIPASDHNDLANAEIAVETKLGYGSSVPTISGHVLKVTGAGQTAWGPGGGSSSSVYFNVKDYGAIGNGTTDDTSASQIAIDACHAAGGGTVYFPAGIYKLATSPLKLYSSTTPTIIAYSNITLKGDGSSADGAATIIRQTTSGVDCLLAINDAANSAQTENIIIEDINFDFGGTVTNSGNGVYFKAQAAGSPPFVECALRRVTVTNCQGSGKYGFNFESLITSSLVSCSAVGCANGFFLDGSANSTSFSSVNTSVTMIGCYANMTNNAVIGYNMVESNYTALIGCACDFGSNSPSATAYKINECLGFSLQSCGFETGNVTLGIGFEVTGGSRGTGIYNCYGYQSKSTKEIYITGNSDATIIGYFSDSSVSGSTGLQVDSGSTVTDINCGWDTGPVIPVSISGTRNTIADSDAMGIISAGTAVRVGGINVPTISSTDVLTNKRVTPRVGTVTSSATPTINTNNVDIFTVTALAAAITSMTSGLSGTPTTGQKLRIGFKDTGTGRSITWGASFVSSGVSTLLATTVANKQHWVDLMYDGSHWVCTAVDATGY